MINREGGERVFFISLGCAKNLVDSEHMLGLLEERGFSLVETAEEADAVVINTCGFIREAVEETIDTIMEAVSLKKGGSLRKLAVVGCFVQRYGYKLGKEIPEVDVWLGTGEIWRIADALRRSPLDSSAVLHISRPCDRGGHYPPRVQTTPFFTAFLRIGEGCSHGCSYCLIPALRGRYRSRLPGALIQEAEEMAERGVKEINVIAQDTTMYGRDLGDGTCLESLLEGLLKVKGISWIRILYCHPGGVSDRLLELIDSEERICPYLDIPLQHVNRGILEAMGRGPDGEPPRELIQRIRSCRRTIVLRTTFIVGFPGETEEMFEELCHFVESVRFDHVGTFVFSPEKGTRAARLNGAVGEKEAFKRRERLMTLQAGISEELNRELVGSTLKVLVEGVSPETELLLTGRTAGMAPDTDSRVLINKGVGIPGKIMKVLINEAHPYDLVGEILE